MVELLSVEEGRPLDYPALTLAFDEAVIWQRIEAWCGHRWGARAVTWVVRGAGEWIPPLTPYSVDQAYKWNGATWEQTTLAYSAVGLWLEGCDYKIEATVGDANDSPAAVDEAAQRLAEFYAAHSADDAGVTSITDGDYSRTINASAMARAMQYSGAADLLRPYR